MFRLLDRPVAPKGRLAIFRLPPLQNIEKKISASAWRFRQDQVAPFLPGAERHRPDRAPNGSGKTPL